MSDHRLIVIAGPSCTGKTPLWKALGRRYRALAETMQKMVVYNDRAPRPDEEDGRDYHFSDRETIARFEGDPHYVVCEVRGDLQAVDLDEQHDVLHARNLVYEGNPTMGLRLLRHPTFASVKRLGIFVSPLAAAELAELAERGADEPRASVTRLMRRRLMRRTMRKHDLLELPQLEDIEQRARAAYGELRTAPQFDRVLVVHDGEDSDHWELTGVALGSARRAVDDLAALLRGQPTSAGVEQWSPDTLPSG